MGKTVRSAEEVESELKSVCGVDEPTQLLQFVTFVHLISPSFFASRVFTKGTKCCVIGKNKICNK